MKKFNKNGLLILNEGFEKTLLKKAAKAAKKEYSEGGIVAPLAEKIKKAAKAAKAAEKTATKAAKAEILSAAAKKAAAKAAKEAANAAKLLKFVKGEAASFFFDEEIEATMLQKKFTPSSSLYDEGSFNINPSYMAEIFAYIEGSVEASPSIIEDEWGNKSIPVQEIKKILERIDAPLSLLMGGVFKYLVDLTTSDYSDDFSHDLGLDLIKLEAEKFLSVAKNREEYRLPWNLLNSLRVEGRKKINKALGVLCTSAHYHNVDPKVFVYFERIAREKFGFTNEEIPCLYDSMGDRGINPSVLVRVYYDSGAKLGGKFRVFVHEYLKGVQKTGDGEFFDFEFEYPSTPKKKESVKDYKQRIVIERFLDSFPWDHPIRTNYYNILLGEKKRVARLSKKAMYIALMHCTQGKEINWEKLSQILKMDKKEMVKFLPMNLAWKMLFGRNLPIGLGKANSSLLPLFRRRGSQKAFMQLRKIIVKEVEAYSSEEAASNLAAFNLSVLFGDFNQIKQWVKKVENAELSALSIHDSFVKSDWLLKVAAQNREAWKNFLFQYPEVRWSISNAPAFEQEFGRLPRGKAEFEEFCGSLSYEDVKIKEVAKIAASFDLDQEEFEDYQEFFLETSSKRATMLPGCQVSEGSYTFEKLDDHDFMGPFLGLATDCCQHLHNAGSSCAKAGWRDPESGFYVIKKDDDIVAQSWAWRGSKGELVFDSIEGLGNVNIQVIALLYKRAAQQLLGKLGVTRVLVGDTDYGLTPDIKEELEGQSCKAAKMIKSVSYSDADNQWLLAE